jgi:hypothetical protein
MASEKREWSTSIPAFRDVLNRQHKCAKQIKIGSSIHASLIKQIACRYFSVEKIQQNLLKRLVEGTESAG